MPVKCPRCGKELCTPQALTYHLNKKKRCDDLWRCYKCEQKFDTRIELAKHSDTCPAIQNHTYEVISKLMRCSGGNNDNVYELDDDLKVVRSSIAESNKEEEVNTGSTYVSTLIRNQRSTINAEIKTLTGHRLVRKVKSKKDYFIDVIKTSKYYVLIERSTEAWYKSFRKTAGGYTP